jgi:hypothetical protein
MRAYQANRRAAIEDLIEADPVATRVREIMVDPQDVDGKCVRPSPRRGNNGHPFNAYAASLLSRETFATKSAARGFPMRNPRSRPRELIRCCALF